MYSANGAASVATPGPAVVDSQASELAAKIIDKFNTWAFKREQPARLTLLQKTVTRQVSICAPINFILYWGKGPRHAPAAPEIQCMDFLGTLAKRIATIYEPGAQFTLCLTDTHARLNGHKDEAIEAYFIAVEKLAAERNMRCVRLSEVVRRHAPTKPPPHRDTEALIAALTRSAERWYRGPQTPADGARRYLAMNMVERVAIERYAPDNIFVTFNGSDLEALFPENMPIFYMYSLKRGTAVKPWFLDAQGRPAVLLS